MKKTLILLILAISLPSFSLVLAATGNLQVNGEPGITIFIDGVEKGITNANENGKIIEGLSEWTHHLIAVKKGSNQKDFTVTISPNKTTVVQLKFESARENVAQGDSKVEKNSEKKGRCFFYFDLKRLKDFEEREATIAGVNLKLTLDKNGGNLYVNNQLFDRVQLVDGSNCQRPSEGRWEKQNIKDQEVSSLINCSSFGPNGLEYIHTRMSISNISEKECRKMPQASFSVPTQ